MVQSKVPEIAYHITIYLSGPSLHGNVAKNRLEAITIANQLIDIGAVVLCPHLFYYFDKLKKRDFDTWINIHLKWVATCNAFYKFGEHSPESNLELALAVEFDKPIFNSIDEVKKWLLS